MTLTYQSPFAFDIERNAAAFSAEHYFHIPGLISGRELAIVLDAIQNTKFYEFTHPTGSREQRADDALLKSVLQLVLNETALLQQLERITRVGPLDSFTGNVYRIQPGGCHYGEWHDDCIGDRLLGMTVNLSSQPFQGGEFELRERDSLRAPRRFLNNAQPGDALVFRIDPKFEHRVAPVTGTIPKLAFAGWFLKGGSWLDKVKEVKTL